MTWDPPSPKPAVPPPARRVVRDLIGGRDPYTAAIAIGRTAGQALLGFAATVLMGGDTATAAGAAAVMTVIAALQNLLGPTRT